MWYFFREIDFDERWIKVSDSINAQGSYNLTYEELIFGARTAWRNAGRCPGRSQWNTLNIRDCRHITNVEDMFKEICIHLEESTNHGTIIPTISVFPQRKSNGKDLLRLWNGQLISFAGYPHPEDPKAFIGDKGNVTFTQVCG